MATRTLLAPGSRQATRRRLLPIALACGVAMPATTSLAQQTARVGGALVERGTRAPIEGARISVLGTNLGTSTNENGRFELSAVPTGVRVLQIRAIGFQVGSWMVDLSEGQIMSDTFTIERRNLLLDTLTVTAETDAAWRTEAGFNERMARGRGYFIPRQEIRSRQAASITDLLHGIAGISTACGNRGCQIRMNRGGRAPCTPEYFLDGYPASNATGPNFPIQQIRGVEVYRDRFETPTEFQRPNLSCGVIVIWTVEPGTSLERR